MARVAIDAKAFNDPRFTILAKLVDPSLEFSSKFEMIGRMAAIWQYCTEYETHFLSPELIDTIAEFDGFHKLVSDPRVNLAEVTSSGIRIKGTEGRIEWIKKLRKSAKMGGEKRSAIRHSKRSAIRQTSIAKELSPLTPTLTPTLTPVLLNTNTLKAFALSTSVMEDIYEKYPRKEGKQKGMALLRRDLKSAEDIALVEQAICRYSNHVRQNKTEPKYIKQFSTFMGSWRDWTEPEAGKIKFTRPLPKEPSSTTAVDQCADDRPSTPEEIEKKRAMFERLRKEANLRL